MCPMMSSCYSMSIKFLLVKYIPEDPTHNLWTVFNNSDLILKSVECIVSQVKYPYSKMEQNETENEKQTNK